MKRPRLGDWWGGGGEREQSSQENFFSDESYKHQLQCCNKARYIVLVKKTVFLLDKGGGQRVNNEL